jgi:hypothetical protein
VVGWIRPVVPLPAATVLGLTPQQLEAVLAHELAHILRYDFLVNMLQTVAETLLFYHPAVWWASARIRQERELCCDDLAVETCGDVLCYARALTRSERLRVTTPSLALGSAGGPLLYRIQRLAGDAGWQRGPSKLPGILALTLGLMCFALNMQRARGRSGQRCGRVERAAGTAQGGAPIGVAVAVHARCGREHTAGQRLSGCRLKLTPPHVPRTNAAARRKLGRWWRRNGSKIWWTPWCKNNWLRA